MIIHSEAEMLNFGRDFAKNLSLPAVFELVGDVGAGKTTFTRGLAEGLKIAEPITSPSFTISKRYAFPLSPELLQKCCKNYNTNDEQLSGELIHYDFYRLSGPGLMRDEIAESINSPTSVIVVEWGGDVADLLPEDHIRLDFVLQPDGSREVTIARKTGN